MLLEKIVSNVENVMVGKREVIELVLISLLCKGHVLIEDVPGVGKTMMVSSIAKSIDAKFNRIQFTPDIMPSDITGFSIFNQKIAEFEYRQGSIMSQLVLADEINRASPKTQSALLEVMEENQVTVDGKTYPLLKPFMVLATQNPVDFLGTYPLPEAQLDRFFMKVSIGYPSAREESELLTRFQTKNPLDSLEAVADIEEILEAQRLVETIHVAKEVNDYIVSLVRATREKDVVLLGASPRASLCLYRASQALAFYKGRDYVTPDDVQKMSLPILEHRLMMKQEAKFKKITATNIIETIVRTTKIPAI